MSKGKAWCRHIYITRKGVIGAWYMATLFVCDIKKSYSRIHGHQTGRQPCSFRQFQTGTEYFFCNKKCYTFLWSVKLNLVALPYISLLSITACGTKNINKARSLKQQQLNQIISLTVSLCIQLCYLLACCTHCAVVSISTQIQDKYFRMRNFTNRWKMKHMASFQMLFAIWKCMLDPIHLAQLEIHYGPMGHWE